MSILLKNATLVDYHTELKSDLLMENGKITQIGEDLSSPIAKIMDCTGLTILPSFVDLHAHFRDPGFTQKEDIHSGCKAAAHGGFTTVNLMPNTNPVCSTMDTVNYVKSKAKELNICDVEQTVSITNNFNGNSIEHLENIDSSVKWLTDDGNGIDNTQIMLDVIELACKRGFGLMLHEEHRILTPINSYLAEDLHTFRDSQLALNSNCKIHFCHVSTKKSIDFIHSAKKKGANVSCEVTPHHLYLSDVSSGKVAPPLRRDADRLALIEAVKNGKVDAIATDHAPHTPEDKANGANGFTGLDLAFATCYTVLVKNNNLPLSKLSKLMSYNPAQLMNIAGGFLAEGNPANLVIVDLNKSFVVTKEHVHSRSKNTPMLGEKLYGEIIATYKEGEAVYEKSFN